MPGGWRALSRADLGLVFVGILLMAPRYAAAARTFVVTRSQGMTLGVHQIFLIGLVSRFYSLAPLGGLAGGVVRWHRMAKPDRMPAGSLATIVFDRIVDGIGIVLVGGVLWSLDGHPGLGPAGPLGVGLLLLGLLFLYGLALQGSAAESLARFLDRVQGFPRPVRRRAQSVLRALAQLGTIGPIERARLLFWTLIKESLGVVGQLCVVLAVGLPLGFVTIGWIRGLLSGLMLLPIGRAGLGVREVGLVLLPAPYGIAGGDALPLSLLLSFGAIVVSLSGGLVELPSFWSAVRVRRSWSDGSERGVK